MKRKHPKRKLLTIQWITVAWSHPIKFAILMVMLTACREGDRTIEPAHIKVKSSNIENTPLWLMELDGRSYIYGRDVGIIEHKPLEREANR